MNNDKQNVPETGSLSPPAPSTPRKVITDDAGKLKRGIPTNPSRNKVK